MASLTARLLAGTVVLLGVFLLAACSRAGDPSGVAAGGCGAEASLYLPADESVADARITSCDGGDAWTGRVVSPVWPAGVRRIAIKVAGYPENAGIAVRLRSTDGRTSRKVSLRDAGERWETAVVAVPPDMRAHAFSLVVEDGAPGFRGWVGIGIPAPVRSATIFRNFSTLVLPVLCAHLWLCLTMAVLPRKYEAHAKALWALVALGLAGGFAFVAWWSKPVLGAGMSLLLLMAPMAAMRSAAARARLKEAQGVLLPSLLLAVLILWLGLFPFEWTGADWRLPAQRWTPLPVDNWLPLIFAQMVSAGGLNVPMLGDWLSSDRPPLQTGIYLMFWPLRGLGDGWSYQALSTWLQCLVLVPTAALAERLRLTGANRVLALMALSLSPLVLLNGLYVWPKLIAAGYCAIYHLAVFNNARTRLRASAVLAGLAAGLAMLSHGGALFALAGTTIAALLLRRGAAVRDFTIAAPTALLVYLPWVLYQRLVDPPGDRLLKWHFAGQIAPTDASLVDVLRTAYAGKTFATWWHERLSNLDTILTGFAGFPLDLWRLLVATLRTGENLDALQRLIDGSFFHFVYGAWFFGPIAIAASLALALLLRRRLPSACVPLSAGLVISLAAWILLMYLPGSTLVHHGAYFANIALSLIAMSLLAAASTFAFRTLAACSILLGLAVYAFGGEVEWMVADNTYAAGVLMLAALLAWSMSRRLAAPDRNPDMEQEHL